LKKAISLLILFVLISCNSTSKITGPKPLYEILISKSDGGASIRFFETLSEEREIKMLQSDADLKKKIKVEDIKTANFVILNMGEQTTFGYKITVDKVAETEAAIILTVRDIPPTTQQTSENEVFYYPVTIVKINSKKQLIIQ